MSEPEKMPEPKRRSMLREIFGESITFVTPTTSIIMMLLALLVPTVACAQSDTAEHPKWIAPAIADALDRLSPELDTVSVCQGTGRGLPDEPERLPQRAMVGRFGALIEQHIYHVGCRPLSLMIGSDEATRKTCDISYIVHGFSQTNAEFVEGHVDAATVYIFRVGVSDPARTLKAKLESDSSVQRLSIDSTEVFRKEVLVKKRRGTTEDFYYFSPRRGVAVIVRRKNLLSESVKRWTDPNAATGPLPWTIAEWTSIRPTSTSWGISRNLSQKDSDTWVFCIDAKNSANAVQVTNRGLRDAKWLEVSAGANIRRHANEPTIDATITLTNDGDFHGECIIISDKFLGTLAPYFE